MSNEENEDHNDIGPLVQEGNNHGENVASEEDQRRAKLARKDSFESLTKIMATEGARIEITVSHPEVVEEAKEEEGQTETGEKRRHTITVSVSPERREETPAFEVKCGVSSIQGRRKSMEDAHQSFPNIKVVNQSAGEKQTEKGAEDEITQLKEVSESIEKELVEKAVKQHTVCSFFGVYDGHGGRRAADYVATHLHENIINHPHFHTDLVRAIKEGFAATEASFLILAKQNNFGDGTTAIVAFITEDGRKLTVGNIGDSEAVLCRSGKAVVLTTVHNPSKNPSEIERVKRDGGRLYHDTRLAHPALNPSYFNLGVSRAIGDLMFKHPDFTKGKASGLTAEADVSEVQLREEDQFFILACDGLWDVMSHQEAVDFVLRNMVSADYDPQLLASEMVEEAYKRGSTDNITVMVCILRDLGKSRDDSMNATICGWENESEDTEHDDTNEEKEDDSEVRKLVEQEKEGCVEMSQPAVSEHNKNNETEEVKANPADETPEGVSN